MSSRTTIIGGLLGCLFLVLALWNIDFRKLATSLSTFNYWYLLPATMMTALGYGLRTARWGRILHPTRQVALRELFQILMIGFMANNVLPARVGEIARAYVLSRRQGISKTLGLSTILLERLLDGLTLVVFVGLLSLLFPLPEWSTELARVAGVVFVVGGIAVAALLTRGKLVDTILLWIGNRLPRRLGDRANAMSANVLLGLNAVSRQRLLLAVVVFSLLVWFAEAGSYFLIIEGFGLPLKLPTAIIASIFLLVVVNLGIMLPSAPGYVGTFQAFAVLALSAFGVQKETALGIAVVSHGMQYVLVTGLGLIFLSSGRLTLSGIRSE